MEGVSDSTHHATVVNNVHKDLRTLFCEQMSCPPAEYEERIFRACLYRHAAFVAKIARGLTTRLFQTDFMMLRYLGHATSPQAVTAELNAFKNGNRNRFSFIRTALKLRVSGRRVIRLAETVFSRGRHQASKQQ
jgi:hypothetical protein